MIHELFALSGDKFGCAVDQQPHAEQPTGALWSCDIPCPQPDGADEISGSQIMFQK